VEAKRAVDIAATAIRIVSDLQLPTQRWIKPVLIGIFGVPGVGKTQVAHALAQRYPLLVLSTDALRLQYGFESGLVTRQVIDQLAIQLFAQHISIIFDGIHLGRKDRRAVEQLAHSYQADALLMYVVADPVVVEQRLQARIERSALVAAEGKFVITAAHFRQIVSYLEPPTDDERVITIDTSHNRIDEQLDRITKRLNRCLHGG
jgi:predicted kinase